MTSGSFRAKLDQFLLVNVFAPSYPESSRLLPSFFLTELCCLYFKMP